MRIHTTSVLCLLSAQAVYAHMQLVLPPAINSKSDPQTAEADIDYSMTAPLNKDGSNFPAKKYATKAKLDSMKPVATLVAGQEFSWNLGGTAVHNGGSCQVAISYDLMETMVVIASWIGGCPLSLPYRFKVPDIPGCDKCFFIWDWFNKAGNREMYQNAAVVSISGTAKQFVGPQIYRANTFGEDICETTEGVEVVFPAPGDQVFYAAGTSANSPATDLKCPGWDNKKIVTVTGPGNGPKATAPVGGATGSPATDTKALNGSPPAGTGTGTAAAKPTNSGATGGAATSSEAAGPESSAGGDSEPTGAGAPPSTGGAETTATLDTSPDDADSESLIGSGNNNRTFLLFAGGFVALIVLAGVSLCLSHPRHYRRRSGYESASSADDEDDSESPSDRPRRHRQRPRRRSTSRRRHRKEKSTSESSSDSTN